MKIFNSNFVKICTLFFLLTISTLTSAFAWDSKGVKEARDFVDVGRVDQAISVLVNWTSHEAKDFDAYWLLAEMYITKGLYGQAEEQFNYALHLRANKQEEVTSKFKIAFKHELARGNIDTAKSLAQTVVNYEPKFKQQVYQEFYNNGKKVSGQNAVDNFRNALVFAATQEEQVKIGKQYLRLILVDYHFSYLLSDAKNIVGQEIVDQIMPSQRVETVFTRTYTDADANKDGIVELFKYSEINIFPGDVLSIQTTVPNDNDIVRVSEGMEYVKIPNNGGYKFTYSNSPKNGNQELLFNKKIGSKARVELIRTVSKKANMALLANL